MTKDELQQIAKSVIKAVQPMRIRREDKEHIYYALITGLAQSEGFGDDHLRGYDLVFTEQLREYKKRNKDKLLPKLKLEGK
jgi:hypothetical protein